MKENESRKEIVKEKKNEREKKKFKVNKLFLYTILNFLFTYLIILYNN